MGLPTSRRRLCLGFTQIAALALSLAVCGAANAETLTGKVVRVVDGDTIVVLGTQKTQHRVRLGGIDAPERRQPYGKTSTERLAHPPNSG
jgi:endonuclease YncB( thermonuclease family)